MKTDVVVLGAGIVGLSTAIHLARRGKSVVLLDRRGAGEETSYGNAGLIQREGVFPYGFPHDFGALFRYALNNTIGRPLSFPCSAGPCAVSDPLLGGIRVSPSIRTSRPCMRR